VLAYVMSQVVSLLSHFVPVPWSLGSGTSLLQLVSIRRNVATFHRRWVCLLYHLQLADVMRK
jgi:hypothetical protein